MILERLKKAVVFTAFFLFGCSSDQARINKAFYLAQQNNYKHKIIKSSLFPIQIFYQENNSNHAVIYLEGDGLVINKYGEVALDPTPTDPMALRLASIDKRHVTKIVINRPFHYIKSKHSDSRYWTTARYAPEVIQSILEVLRNCQKQFHFKTIEIVAYSGGASVALLLAPHLENIEQITSFAGNLDHKSWARYHNAGPLFESLDPLKNKAVLGHIPQVHFLGTIDENTTIDLGKQYKQQIDTNKVTIVTVEEFDHDSNWPSVWQEQLMKLE